MTIQSGSLSTNLNTFADRYTGRRAFIIGNGPSLQSMDLAKLKDEITFGVNNIFYNFGQMGFKPTFYVVEDKLVAEDRAEEIKALAGMTKIFGTELQYCLGGSLETIWANVIYDFRNYPGFPNFSKDAAQCLWVGGTVSYICMQLVYYMGFSEVYLVGFDHSYTIPKDAKIEGNVITSVADDSNHFHPEYFGKGKRWHDPRTDRMEKAYIRAKEAFEQGGRKIYNATMGGKLEIFPRVDYWSLFNESPRNAELMPPVAEKIEEMRTLWDNLSKKSKLGYISHLQKGAKWDNEEFHIVGTRFAGRMIERFKDYCSVEPNSASVLEIGCGVGRFIKPLASYFRYVTGVDISREMLKVAKEYCSDLSNVTFILNDGKSLKECESNSFDYCVSAGVFHHITHIEVIISYIRDAIRVLKPSGLFLFQFEGNRTEAVGKGSTGARITDRVLDTGLEGLPYGIREVSIDPDDPVRNVVIVIQKLAPDQLVTGEQKSFQQFKMIYSPWISGVYDGIRTKTRMHKRLKNPAKMLTFYDKADANRAIEKSCERAKHVFEQNGGKTFNATVGDKLEVVPRIDYEIPFAVHKNIAADFCKAHPAPQEAAFSKSTNDNNVRMSVVVCTRRNPSLLARTLDSLIRQSLDRALYEVIVVDNNSQDNTKGLVESYPSVKYVFEEKLGLSCARNTGIENARGDVVAFIDDDAEADPDWVGALLKVYDTVSDAWAVGGKVLPIWDAEKPDWLTEEYYRSLSLVEWGEETRALHWPHRIIGTNCSFRKEAFSSIGKFKPELGRIGSLPLSFEDTEIQQRIAETGHLVYYTPDATVYHHVPAFRMTEECFCSRSLGNHVSQILMILSEKGYTHEVHQFVNGTVTMMD